YPVSAEVPAGGHRRVDADLPVPAGRRAPPVADHLVRVDHVAGPLEAQVVDLEPGRDEAERRVGVDVALLLVERDAAAETREARGGRVQLDVVCIGALEVVDRVAL